MKSFYSVQCPICLVSVEVQQQDSFLVLPVYPADAEIFSCKDWKLGKHSVITIDDLRLSQIETYPTLGYRQRSFLIHRRCYELVGRLSPPQLRLLVDVVEPTFLPLTAPLPPVIHGAFFSPNLYRLQSIEQLLYRLPPEIQDKILKRDIGRLLFVMRTASQLAIQCTHEAIPEHRFTEEILTLQSNSIRVFLVVIGGRTYISHLSNTPSLVLPLRPRRHMLVGFVSGFLNWIIYLFAMQWKYIIPFSVMTTLWFMLFVYVDLFPPREVKISHEMAQDYQLDKSNYLAIQSDGLGVIDIAFQQNRSGPEWILNSHAHPFQGTISVIRCADSRRLRIIRDTHKCRAIIPLNRCGAEPYFCGKLLPPHDSWIDSGFPVKSDLTLSHAPFAYFTHATYISFATTRNISFQVDHLRWGITEIEVDVPNPSNKMYFVDFHRPPRSLRFSLCGKTVAQQHTFQFPYFQFEVDGQWRPPLPPRWFHLQDPIIVKNVLGIWYGGTFPFVPLHIGIVVSDKANLRNTII